MSKDKLPYVYVLHFSNPVGGRSSHYCGVSHEPMTRARRHARGTSQVRIVEACHEQGHQVYLSTIIPVPDRKSERMLKRSKNLKRYCKFCNPDNYRKRVKNFVERELEKYSDTEHARTIRQMMEVFDYE